MGGEFEEITWFSGGTEGDIGRQPQSIKGAIEN